MEMIKKNIVFICLFSCVFISGCGVKYVAKPLIAPQIVYCFDTVGHRSGAGPFIKGGTCCCTPSEAVLQDYIQHKQVSEDTTLESLIAEYQQRDIITALDLQDTNNLEASGPHIVFGGSSMVPPTPGTQNYEDVLFGYREDWKITRKFLKRRRKRNEKTEE
ncbi:MAG: hypothetical protein ABIH47_08275 [Candidatus Omnitrophota bacterium]